MSNEIRINKLLSEMGICSRREADKLIGEGRVKVNGQTAEPGLKVSEGAKIEIDGKPVSEYKRKITHSTGSKITPGLTGRRKDSGNPARADTGEAYGTGEKDAAAWKRPEPVVLAFNKPRGIVCTESYKDRAPNIIDYIGYKDRIFTIGRLDKDSEGLILLTNRGELVNLINKASMGHEKEYVVRCTHRLTEGFLKKMAAGVEIKLPVKDAPEGSAGLKKEKTAGIKNAGESGRAEKKSVVPGKDSRFTDGAEYKLVKTKPCMVRQIDDHTFNIILTQGLNRQIRRMTAALGNNVERLKRIRVMNVELKGLKEGQYRKVTGSELKELEKLAGLKH